MGKTLKRGRHRRANIELNNFIRWSEDCTILNRILNVQASVATGDDGSNVDGYKIKKQHLSDAAH